MKLCIDDQLVASDQKISLLLKGLGFLTVLCWSHISAADLPAQIDSATQQWLSIERQTNQLQSDWREQSSSLKQRISILNAEKKQLAQLLSKNNNSENDVDHRRSELLKEQTVLEKKQQSMTQAIHLLGHTTKSLTPFLPPLLMKSWQEVESGAVHNSHEKRSGSQASNSEKLQQALAKLTKLTEFDQRISTHESTIENAQGNNILVQQLFLGAGTAWFVSRDNKQAGWGHSGNEGWVWIFDENIAADSINTAIAMFQKRKTADWVELPIYLKGDELNSLSQGALKNHSKHAHQHEKEAL